MLARRLGSERAAAEPAAGTRLTSGCAPGCRWPWPSRPPVPPPARDSRSRHWPPNCGDEPTRLEVLDGGDPATSVQAVFSWSYQKPELARRRARSGCWACILPGITASIPLRASPPFPLTRLA